MSFKSNHFLYGLLLVFLFTTACTAAPTAEPEIGGQANNQVQETTALTALTPVTLAAGEKLQVVATTTIIADIARQVGGSQIDLITLLPAGSDPHTFEPTPRDLAAVADAHLVLANGLGLEGFLERMIGNVGGEATLVYVSEGIMPRYLSQESSQDHSHDGVDPHTWTSPANALVFVKNIKGALLSLDPANAATYEANAATYTAELKTLDAWVMEQIATIPPDNRKLVTDHAIFGYYADRYGLEQVGAVIPSFSTNAEPSAQELAGLADLIKKQGVQAVFVGNTVNPTLSEQVAQDTGIALLRLYTGSLGPEGSEVDSYLNYIRYNTETIVEGLR